MRNNDNTTPRYFPPSAFLGDYTYTYGDDYAHNINDTGTFQEEYNLPIPQDTSQKPKISIPHEVTNTLNNKDKDRSSSIHPYFYRKYYDDRYYDRYYNRPFGSSFSLEKEYGANIPIPQDTSQKPKISIPEEVISKSTEKKKQFTQEIKHCTDYLDYCPGYG